jgi:hypothetical protein
MQPSPQVSPQLLVPSTSGYFSNSQINPDSKRQTLYHSSKSMLRSHRPAHPSPPNAHQRERAASKALARTWHSGGCVYFSPTNYQPRFQWQQPIQWDVDSISWQYLGGETGHYLFRSRALRSWVDEHWLLGERCFHGSLGIWRQL